MPAAGKKRSTLSFDHDEVMTERNPEAATSKKDSVNTEISALKNYSNFFKHMQ